MTFWKLLNYFSVKKLWKFKVAHDLVYHEILNYILVGNSEKQSINVIIDQTLQNFTKVPNNNRCLISLCHFLLIMVTSPYLFFSFESLDMYAIFAGSGKWLRFPTFDVPSCKP